MSCVALCRLDELSEGQALGFGPRQRGADSLFAVRHGGQIRVFNNHCPHLGTPLEYRKNRFLSADGQWVVCYAHNARFRPDTGECVYGPCLGESLTLVTHREHNGWLLVPLVQLQG